MGKNAIPFCKKHFSPDKNFPRTNRFYFCCTDLYFSWKLWKNHELRKPYCFASYFQIARKVWPDVSFSVGFPFFLCICSQMSWIFNAFNILFEILKQKNIICSYWFPICFLKLIHVELKLKNCHKPTKTMKLKKTSNFNERKQKTQDYQLHFWKQFFSLPCVDRRCLMTQQENDH